MYCNHYVCTVLMHIYVYWQSSVRLLVSLFWIPYYLYWWWCASIVIVHLCFVLIMCVCIALHVLVHCAQGIIFSPSTVRYILKCIYVLPWQVHFTFFMSMTGSKCDLFSNISSWCTVANCLPFNWFYWQRDLHLWRAHCATGQSSALHFKIINFGL